MKDISDETGNKSMKELGFEQPKWMEQEVCLYTVDSIRHSGCSSGSYMPAVTYVDATRLMYAYGDDIINFLDQHSDYCSGEFDLDPEKHSYGGWCCRVVSAAVECWAHSIPEDHDFEGRAE
ncbi:MAG: hypothetical protein AAF608_05115 [Pseudomonadota bacterium]